MNTLAQSLIASVLTSWILAASPASTADPQPAEVSTALKRSADWHLANPSGIDSRDWIIAPLYDGLARLAVTTGDAKYLAAVLRFGTQSGWMPDNRIYPAEVPIGETSGSGFFVFGLTWGVNNGLLEREKYWPVIQRGWAGLMTRVKPDGFVGYVQAVGAAPGVPGPDTIQDYGTGAFLLAGCEVLRALGGAEKVDPGALLASAEKLVAEDKTPSAYARLVPERKDDLAWENDKVAFRVYGPALRSGAENSGIDAWCKRVPYPVLDKWYDQDRLKKISYHKDTGEGYDGYHVGDTRGCGGLGLWVDDKLVTSDTYISAEIKSSKEWIHYLTKQVAK